MDAVSAPDSAKERGSSGRGRVPNHAHRPHVSHSRARHDVERLLDSTKRAVSTGHAAASRTARAVSTGHRVAPVQQVAYAISVPDIA
eukprot:2618292-Rhodomonas_salina.2